MKGLILVIGAAFVVYAYSQNLPSVNCPDNKDGNVTFAPHPCNCNTYYVCFADSAIPMPCPPDLHFNPVKNVCDWPWKAKCKIQPNCPSVPSSQNFDNEQVEA